MFVKDPNGNLIRAVRDSFAPGPPEQLGVAVSGGSDSLAMLHLLAEWSRQGGPQLFVVTIDHGLRAGAAHEAAGVAKLCATLKVPHETRHWQGWDHKGNLQDQARRARLRLISQWAQELGLDTVCLGHTADDQAETFLMRLARGSGVDGLCAMNQWRRAEGIWWVRPVLELRRWELRDYLHSRGVRWFDDPTNEDESFDRVRMRKALAVLEPLGISAKSLADTAARLQAARAGLRQSAHDRARWIALSESGDVLFDRTGLFETGGETRDRLIAHAICWVGVAEYRPRQESLAAVWESIVAGRSTVLQGCQIVVTDDAVRITREFNAVKRTVAAPHELWDARWRISGPLATGYEVRALGEAGLQMCPDWRETGMPRATLMASPAVWNDEKLLAAPLAGLTGGWGAVLACGDDDFFSSLITH